MKIKSLAMLAASGLMAASIAYVAPALADDTSGQSMQQAPASTDSGSSTSAPADNSNTGSSTDSGASNDQGSPDTATGDDDY